MRVASFLPSGTEIVHALGAGSSLVGRSHECDYPSVVADLPVVSRPSLALEGLSPDAADRAVSERMSAGESMYLIDERLLRQLAPDVILTQNLCRVCAPSGNELSRAVRDFPSPPEILFLTPQSLEGIERNIREVGDAIGRAEEADRLIAANRARIERVQSAVRGAPVRRVAFLEWTDPPFCAGHWVPEMIELAGGHDPLGRRNADSRRVTWDEIRGTDPELVVVSPCGFRLEESVKLAQSLPSFGSAEVWAVDANAYYARPGPRAAEAIELLAHLFHPDRFAWPHAARPWARIAPGL